MNPLVLCCDPNAQDSLTLRFGSLAQSMNGVDCQWWTISLSEIELGRCLASWPS